MKYKFQSAILLFSSMVYLLACKKDNANTINDDKFKLIQQNTWLLDSTNTIATSYNVMQRETITSTYKFNEDTLVVLHDGNPISIFLKYEIPNKIYTWLPREVQSPNQYMLIDNINTRTLILREVDVLANVTRVRYLHSL